MNQQGEILAPVGNFEMLHTAIAYGADAVYFGCGHLNARSETAAFSLADIEHITRLCHRHGRRAYLALNTLVYSKEIELAISYATHAMAAGIDAIIVQDFGLAVALRRIFPDLVLHGSTQMTIGSPGALRWAQSADIKRIILPRELTFQEINSYTREAHSIGLETEVFVHGALCVSVSGQCSMSRLLGGRSANRGECAGPCRQEWILFEDRTVIKEGAIISPRDQSILPDIAELVATGVDSFKIEGRLRQPTYVAAVVSELSRALSGKPVCLQKLLLAYNRGGHYTQAFQRNEDGTDFLSGEHVGSYGILGGVVVDIDPIGGWLYYRPDDAASLPGDGDVLSVRTPDGNKELASSPARQIKTTGGLVGYRGLHPDVLRKLNRGDRLYRMTDAKFEQEVKTAELPRLPVDLTLSSDDEFVILSAQLDNDFAVVVSRTTEQTPDRPPLDRERLTKQLNKTGNTPFTANRITVDAAVPIRLPISAVNKLRRDVLAELLELLDKPVGRTSGPSQACPDINIRHRIAGKFAAPLIEINTADLAVKNASQAEVEVRVAYPVYRYPDPLPDMERVHLALPVQAIIDWESHHPGQLSDWKKEQQIISLAAILPPAADLTLWLQWDSFLENHSTSLIDSCLTQQMRQPIEATTKPWIHGDFGLNVINELSYAVLAKQNMASVALSPELSVSETKEYVNRIETWVIGQENKQIHFSELSEPNGGVLLQKQTIDLLQKFPAIEILAYGKERAMYMKHCPVGLRRKGCTRCLGHSYRFVNPRQEGQDFELHCHSDRNCWTELRAAEPTDRLAETMDWIGKRAQQRRNIRIIWRIEFTKENSSEQKRIINQLIS
ncbi:MAG TPA: U32 family peptidase [Clostridiaceae bacterium]|nr:U32 family peptidase [Clostridiaceae bacterium]